MNTQIKFGQEVSTKLRSVLIAEAEKIAEKYPQYKNHFNDHLLVVATEEIMGRYSKIADAGEVLLAAPEVLQFRDENEKPHQSICIWDMKEQMAKYVPYSKISFVEKQVKLTLRLDY